MVIDASATTQVMDKVNGISVVRCKPANLPIIHPCAMSEGKTELMRRMKLLFPTRNAKSMVKFMVAAHQVSQALFRLVQCLSHRLSTEGTLRPCRLPHLACR